MNLMRDRNRIKFGTGYETRLDQTAGSVGKSEETGQGKPNEKDHDQSGDAGKICRQGRGVAGECVFKLLHRGGVLFVGLRHERAGSLLLPDCSQI